MSSNQQAVLISRSSSWYGLRTADELGGRSSELSGTVRSVLVDYNSPVKVGQGLAELDTDKLKATLNSSRAKLASAKAKVLDAEATLVEKKLVYERKTTLTTSKFSSQQDLDTAKAAYDRAIAAVASTKADVGVAEADVELNETNLLKSRIVSPINGVVLKRNVDPGQTVASSLQAPVLFTIAEDLTQMEVQVDVDEADVGKVKEGRARHILGRRLSGSEISGAHPRTALRLGGRAGRGHLQSGSLDRQLRASPAAGNDRNGRDHRSACGQCIDGPQRRPSVYPAGEGSRRKRTPACSAGWESYADGRRFGRRANGNKVVPTAGCGS